MKWDALRDADNRPWLRARISYGSPGQAITFCIEPHKGVWIATYWTEGSDTCAVGEYRTERAAKGACRRKAGAMVDRMKRDIRA